MPLNRREFLGLTGALAGAAGLGGGRAAGEEGKGAGGLGPGGVQLTLRVNGAERTVAADPRDTLLDVLRGELQLTGAKKACDRGECGACTVLLDGRAVYACMVPALHARGRDVRTVEGLTPAGAPLHPVQQAFLDHDGFQCGFCTPGQVMATVALVESTPQPTAEQAKAALCGNLCRCGAYNRILEAAVAAGKGK